MLCEEGHDSSWSSILINKKVLRFEFPMTHPSAVAVTNSINQLLEIFSCHILPQPPSGHFIEKFTTFHHFHCKIYLCLACHDLMKLNNVGVPHKAHQRDFALELLLHPHLNHRPFVENFDGDALASLQVPCVVNFGEIALAKKMSNLVLLHQNCCLVIHSL